MFADKLIKRWFTKGGRNLTKRNKEIEEKTVKSTPVPALGSVGGGKTSKKSRYRESTYYPAWWRYLYGVKTRAEAGGVNMQPLKTFGTFSPISYPLGAKRSKGAK